MQQLSELSPKQARFAEAYAQHHNASLACREAGYSPGCASVTGVRLLANHSVLSRIQTLEASAAEAIGVSRQRFLFEIQDAVNAAREKNDPMAMVAAWREIGKVCGFYTAQRIEVNVRADQSAVMGRMHQMTDAELLGIVAAGQACGKLQ